MKPNKDKGKQGLLGDTSSKILITLADTTWRMVLPAIVFVGFGLMADLSLDTKPGLTLLGLAVGLLASVILIVKQLKKIQGNKT